MKIKYLKKLAYLTYIALLIPSVCIPLTEQYKQNHNIISSLHINQSVYSMDKNLLNAGFKIENVNNHAVIMFQNKPMSAEDFYMPGIEGDQALKLYIVIKDTMKNATIYLNDAMLQQQTDKLGNAYIDLYRPEGKYHLKLVNSGALRSNNYYFKLDKPLKLLCSGTKDFDCTKTYY